MSNLPSSLWVFARYLEACSFLFALLFINRKLNISITFVVLSSLTITMLVLIFTSHFPVCYIEDKGLTLFKIVSEYIISALYLISIILLIILNPLRKKIQNLVVFSLVFKIISELSFTLYVDVYGILNIIGHLSFFASTFLIYRAIIYESIRNPYSIIFNDLNEKNTQIKAMYDYHRTLYRTIKHDLLNQLFLTHGYLQLFQKEQNELYLQKSLTLIDKTVETLQGLSSLIASEATVTTTLHPISLRNAIEKVLELYNIDYQISGNCMVSANSTLNSVIDNIVNNAIKHGKSEYVKFDMKEENDKCSLTIANDGKKIPSDEAKKILKESYTKEDKIRLGMYITNKHVTLLNGKIKLKENKDGQVAFEIQLQKAQNSS